MSDLPFLFCFKLFLFYRTVNCLKGIYFTEQYIVEYCWNLQNKHFAYPESAENIRLKFISEKHIDRAWV